MDEGCGNQINAFKKMIIVFCSKPNEFIIAIFLIKMKKRNSGIKINHIKIPLKNLLQDIL